MCECMHFPNVCTLVYSTRQFFLLSQNICFIDKIIKTGHMNEISRAIYTMQVMSWTGSRETNQANRIKKTWINESFCIMYVRIYNIFTQEISFIFFWIKDQLKLSCVVYLPTLQSTHTWMQFFLFWFFFFCMHV